MQLDWMPVLTMIMGLLAVIASNIGLFLWARSESRTDYRHMDTKTDAIRQEISAIRQEISAIRQETSSIITAIREDMKEFHSKLATQDLEFKMRLAAIEEKKRI